MKKLIAVVMLAFVLSVIVGYAVEKKRKVAPAKVTQQNLIGTIIVKDVEGKKVFFLKIEKEEIELEDGANVSTQVGKLCNVTGVIRMEGGKKLLRVSTAQEIDIERQKQCNKNLEIAKLGAESGMRALQLQQDLENMGSHVPNEIKTETLNNLAIHLSNVGEYSLCLGKYSEARQAWQEAIKCYELLGDTNNAESLREKLKALP